MFRSIVLFCYAGITQTSLADRSGCAGCWLLICFAGFGFGSWKWFAPSAVHGVSSSAVRTFWFRVHLLVHLLVMCFFSHMIQREVCRHLAWLCLKFWQRLHCRIEDLVRIFIWQIFVILYLFLFFSVWELVLVRGVSKLYIHWFFGRCGWYFQIPYYLVHF